MTASERPMPVGHVASWGFAAWVWAVPIVVIISELADCLGVTPGTPPE